MKVISFSFVSYKKFLIILWRTTICSIKQRIPAIFISQCYLNNSKTKWNEKIFECNFKAKTLVANYICAVFNEEFHKFLMAYGKEENINHYVLVRWFLTLKQQNGVLPLKAAISIGVAPFLLGIFTSAPWFINNSAFFS